MLEIIFSDISNYMDSYFLKSIALGLICAFVMLTLLNAFKRLEKDEISERRIIVKTTAFFLWIVYGYMVLGIAFLCRKPIFGRQLSLIPFSTPVGNARLLAYQVENILMFIPYGMIIPVLSTYCKKWYWCLLGGIFSSISIEVLQYMTMRGKAQIDDVLLNAAGTMIGWCIIKLLGRWHRRMD